VAERPAVNASPQTFLAHGGFLHLLQRVSTELVGPRPVAEEILRRGPEDPTAKALATLGWLELVDPPDGPSQILSWDLGPGESSVLGCCLRQPGTEAILDDLAARRCAQIFGVPVRGTLGLVLLAKRRGRIAEARPILESIRRAGMYLSDRVLNRALQTVGE
jgi:predicted nucleic acid-binding protein